MDNRPLPPVIARTRRIGWALLAIALLAAAIARSSDGGLRTAAIVTSIIAGLGGVLAVVNALMVRGMALAMRDAAARADPPPRDDQSM